MPGKKPPPKKPPAASEPAWQVILEEIRSQNRATIEAVQSSHGELKRDIAELRGETTARFQVLEAAVRQNGADIRQNSTDIQDLRGEVRQNSADIRILQREVAQNSTDIRRLDEKVDNLSGLEARVSALERQRG